MTAHRHTLRWIGGKKGATCQEMLVALNDYIDGTLDPAICKELGRHLRQCRPCRLVVNTIRKTITLYRHDGTRLLPPSFQSRLHAAARNAWRKTRR